MGMSFVMANYFATFVVLLITYKTIGQVKGQCTVPGCDYGDSSISIVTEIQLLKVELLFQLKTQDQSLQELHEVSLQEIKNQFDTVNMSLQIVNRRLQDQDICIKQGQSIREFLNESFHEIKSQHEDVIKSLRKVDQCLQEQNSFMNNQSADTWKISNGTCANRTGVCDCSDIKASGQTASGVYEVCVGDQPTRVCTSAFCDMETTIGASLVFQRRKDGSVNFNTTWADYKQGFGNRQGEFWLGNEMLHLLTSRRNYKLRVDLEDFHGNKSFAEYASFSIGSAARNYTLTVGGYSGNAGDSMAYNNGRQFTTKDANNDALSGTSNCAQTAGGGWWFGHCSYSILNGRYYYDYVSPEGQVGIKWSDWRGWSYSLKATEMKLVPVA